MRLLTWNCQGNSWNQTCSTIAQMKALAKWKNVDVVCLQETGIYLDTSQAEHPLQGEPNFYLWKENIFGTESRGKKYVFYWYHQDQRCNIGIYVSEDYDVVSSAVLYVGDNLRPVIGVLLSNGKAIYNIHAPAFNDGFASWYFIEALNIIQNIMQDWNIRQAIIVGDFNCNPFYNKYGITQHDNIHNAYLYCATDNHGVPLKTQKSGRCLDYCCCTFQDGHAFGPYNIVLADNEAYSDHNWLIFDFYDNN